MSVYGTVAKTNLKKKMKIVREEFQEQFFRRKMESLADILVQNKISKALELYIFEIIKKHPKQLCSEAPTQYINTLQNNPSQFSTRWIVK